MWGTRWRWLRRDVTVSSYTSVELCHLGRNGLGSVDKAKYERIPAKETDTGTRARHGNLEKLSAPFSRGTHTPDHERLHEVVRDDAIAPDIHSCDAQQRTLGTHELRESSQAEDSGILAP